MNELDQLYAAWLAGPLSAEQSHRLLALLEDPQQRRRWRDLADLDGTLTDRGQAVRAEPASASPHTTRRLRSQPRRARASRWPLALALAASLLLAVGGGLWFLHLDPDLPRYEGRRLARGETVTGPALLRWDDGSQAQLAAMGQVTVPRSGRGLDLISGDLAVVAAHQATGRQLTISSPQAETEVVGTRFSLRCDTTATSLLVEEGRVVFRPRAGNVHEVGAGGMAVAGSPVAPTASLLACWPLDEGQGEVARDASGQGHDGLIHGASWTPEGLRFAGGNDHVAIPALGALADAQTGDYSIAAWYLPEALPPEADWSDPAAGRDALSVIAGRTGWTLGLHLGSDGRFFMQHFLADQSPHAAHAQERASKGRWYHLVGEVVRSAGETRLAVDGVVVGRVGWTPGAATRAYNSQELWHIGISSPDAATCRWPARGIIRDVRLYGRALDAHEIVRLAVLR